jgi:hypothetical protein
MKIEKFQLPRLAFHDPQRKQRVQDFTFFCLVRLPPPFRSSSMNALVLG